MRAWTKIVCLLASSTCAALLGAACTADPEGTAAPAEPTEEAAPAEVPASPAIVPILGRERCEAECRERFDRCVRQGPPRERLGRERRCQRERDLCSLRCRIIR
jgi:hypothetical protein